MKQSKKIFFLLLILILSSCSTPTLKEKKISHQPIKKITEPVEEEKIPLGLYLNQNKTRKLINHYKSSLALNKDIISLEVFLTTTPELSGTQKDLWNQYYSKYQEEKYKIGYKIEYQKENQTITKTIIEPKDTNEIYDDIQVYLYDDINQQNGWYSHLTEEEVNENTIITSIKLTGSTNIDKITSPIQVTAFIYNKNNPNKKLGTSQVSIERE